MKQNRQKTGVDKTRTYGKKPVLNRIRSDDGVMTNDGSADDETLPEANGDDRQKRTKKHALEFAGPAVSSGHINSDSQKIRPLENARTTGKKPKLGGKF